MKYHFFVIFLVLVGILGTAYGQYSGDKVPPKTMYDTKTGETIFPPTYVDFYYSDPRFEKYSVIVEHYRYDIPYMISNGTISQIDMDCSNVELVLDVEPSDKQGWITLALPRQLIDSKTVGDKDDIFIILLDENEIPRSDIAAEHLRVLILPFSNDVSQIKIIGVNYPEHVGENACNGIHDPPFSYLISPLKQFKMGMQHGETKCMEDLTLIQRYDASPACVKPETIPKLIERGWTAESISVIIQDNPDTKDNRQIMIDGALAKHICSELILQCDNEDEHVSFVGKKQDVHDVVVHIPHEGRGQEYFVHISDDTIKDIKVVTTSNIAVNYSIDKNGMIDLDKIPILFDEQYGGIDYDELGYRVAEYDLKKQLSQKNIQYSEHDYLFIEGSTLESYPPHSGYCAFVKSLDGKKYWYGGWFHKDTLSTSKIHDHNPNPCKPNEQSCACNLQKKLAVNNLETFSYFDSSEEESVGNKLQSYLNTSNISNVSNQFVVGKYNLDKGLFVTPFCGKFVGKSVINEFAGSIQFGQVVEFGLGHIPELCAINDDASVYKFTNP